MVLEGFNASALLEVLQNIQSVWEGFSCSVFFLWALKLNGGEKACLLFVDRFINSETARLFIFPTSVLGSSFVTVFAGCCVLYTSPEMSSLVCTVTMYLWKQRMSNILHWTLSFIPVGYLSAWIMPSRLNFTTFHGRRDFSVWTLYILLLSVFKAIYICWTGRNIGENTFRMKVW